MPAITMYQQKKSLNETGRELVPGFAKTFNALY